MEQHSQRVELHVWREEGDEGLWRCRVMSAGTFHTVRFESYEALSAYVVAQLEVLAGYPDFPNPCKVLGIRD